MERELWKIVYCFGKEIGQSVGKVALFHGGRGGGLFLGGRT